MAAHERDLERALESERHQPTWIDDHRDNYGSVSASSEHSKGDDYLSSSAESDVLSSEDSSSDRANEAR